MNSFDNINTSAILDFLEFGLLAPGDDFFYPDQTLRLVKLDTKNKVLDPEKELYESLIQSVGEILESDVCDSIALSGGADSRLILSILIDHFPESLDQLKVYCRYHPQLGPAGDRDSVIVSLLSQQLGFDVVFESPDLHPQAYLFPSDSSQKTCLSGVFGGELLGGALFDNPIFSDEELYSGRRLSRFSQSITENFHDLEAFKTHELEIRYKTLIHSPLSAFYESPSWILPNLFQQYSKTPFINEKFLKILFSCRGEIYKDYSLYVSLLQRFCSKYLFVPINNLVVESHLNKGLEQFGEEPKLAGYHKQITNDLNTWQACLKKIVDQEELKRYSSFLKQYLHLIPTPDEISG
jgi:hypothetical protein